MDRGLFWQRPGYLLRGGYTHWEESIDLRGTQLNPFAKNRVAAMAALATGGGRRVLFHAGWVTQDQFSSTKPRHVDAAIIQSRGANQGWVTACARCWLRMLKNPHGRSYPFTQCTKMAGHFGGSCGNCRWNSLEGSCSIRDAVAAPAPRALPPGFAAAPAGGAALAPVLPAAGTAAAPIVI